MALPETETLRSAFANPGYASINVVPVYGSGAANSIAGSIESILTAKGWTHYDAPHGDGLWPAEWHIWAFLWDAYYLATPPSEPVEKVEKHCTWWWSSFGYYGGINFCAYDPWREIPVGNDCVWVKKAPTNEEVMENFAQKLHETFPQWLFKGMVMDGGTLRGDFEAAWPAWGLQMNGWPTYSAPWSTIADVHSYNGGYTLRAADVEYGAGVKGSVTIKARVASYTYNISMWPGYADLVSPDFEGALHIVNAQTSGEMLLFSSPHQFLLMGLDAYGNLGADSALWLLVAQPYQMEEIVPVRHLGFAAYKVIWPQFLLNNLDMHVFDEQRIGATYMGNDYAPAIMTMRFPVAPAAKSLKPILDPDGAHIIAHSAFLSMSKYPDQDGGIVGLLWNAILVTDKLKLGDEVSWSGWAWKCVLTCDGPYSSSGGFPWASMLMAMDWAGL